MKYFAYGSNMSHKQMNERCPGNTFLYKADLRDYKLIFDGHSKSWGGAGANVVEFSGAVVSGGLFEISEANRAALDCYEGFPKSYNRKEIDVFIEGDKSIKAIVYYATGRELAPPSRKYMDMILEGAEECGLSKEYIDQLRKIKTVSI